jgi:hypothetical protein
MLKQLMMGIVWLVLVVEPTKAADEVKVHNVEYPSRVYGNGAAIVTVEAKKRKAECIGYKDDVPVGSGSSSSYTTANIANVTVLISERSGSFTV